MAVDYPDFSAPVIPGLFQVQGQGVKLVAVAGTAVAIHAAQTCKVVIIKARAANVGTVYLGSSTVTNDETPGTGGLQLAAGDFLTFSETDLAHIFINGAVGDGISYAWW